MMLLMIVGRLPGILAATWFGAQATRLSLTTWALLLVPLAILGLAIWHWRDSLQARLLSFLHRLALGLRR